VAEFLRARTAGPYQATLNGGRAPNAQSADTKDLDPARTQMARLKIH
jgi:hypothetical protein